MKSLKDASALFLDARSHEQYQHGHVKGAVSLPGALFHERLPDFLKQISFAQRIITYSAGEEENLAESLAESLFYAGYGDVFYVEEDWAGWQKKSLAPEGERLE